MGGGPMITVLQFTEGVGPAKQSQLIKWGGVSSLPKSINDIFEQLAWNKQNSIKSFIFGEPKPFAGARRKPACCTF